MEEDRKSVLETVKPTDALGRLRARHSQTRTVMLTIGAIALLGLIFLVGTIIHNTSRGTEGLKVPGVAE